MVQIDESLFRHKPKVATIKFKKKHITLNNEFQHHRGRATTLEMWAFGMVDTSVSPAMGYMEIVARRDAATLLPIIQAS